MLKKEHLVSSVHNQKLAETLIFTEKPQQNGPAILLLHGWRSKQANAIEYAEALAQRGFICMTFDQRGCGSSEGNIDTLSRQDFLDDALTAYDNLATVVGVDPDNISVIGASFGGYLGAILTTRRRVKYLALRAPADYPNAGFEQPHALLPATAKGAWRTQQHQPHDSFALNALHAFSGEVLIVESGKDDQISHQTIANYTHALKDQGKLTYIIMAEAGHSLQDSQSRAEYNKILVDWFCAKIGFPI